ncbi:MAG: DUF86 domain-containing protein [Thermoplasmata archaeon]|nr:DUF86 domain-containing protein [Thermoplasmata archaeon]
MPRSPHMFLMDIVEAIDAIKEFTSGMDFDAFLADRRTRAAVIRYLEVIGEAVKNLPADLREAHPEVNWHAMAAMRDRLIHAYFGASDRVVWDTVTEDLTVLEVQVKDILQGLGPPP